MMKGKMCDQLEDSIKLDVLTWHPILPLPK